MGVTPTGQPAGRRRYKFKTSMDSRKKLGLALGLLLLALPAMGTDLAILHNGFSIRHERRETIGSVTRLYLGDRQRLR